MSAEIASLGLAIDSRQATAAAAALDKLAASAKATGDATDRLAAATGKSQTQIRAIQSMADRAGVSFGTMNARVDAASAGHGRFAQAASAAAQSVSNLANAAAGNGGSGSGSSLVNAADKSNSSFDRLANTLTRRVLFAAAAKEVRDLAQYVWGLNGAIAATADSAQRSSVGGGQFQGLQTSAAYKGVSSTDFSGAMVAFNQQVDLAKSGLGDLKALLAANGKTVGDTATTFGTVADLVKNAASEAQKFSILQQAGLPATAQFVKYMEQGRDAIKAQASAAGKLTDQQLEDAKRIDEAWQRAWINFENMGKRAVVNTASAAGSIWSRGFGPNPEQNMAANALRAGVGSSLGSNSDVASFYKGLGPTGAAGGPDPTANVQRLKELNAQAQQRIAILAPLANVEDQVKAKELELAAASLNLIGVNAKQREAILDVTRAQAEMTRVGAQAQIGVFNLRDAQKAASDQLKAWTAQGLLDPKNLEQYGAASIAAAKKIQELSDAAKVAGSNLPQLQAAMNDAGNFNKQLDAVATASFNNVTTGLTDILDRTKSAGQGFADLSKTVIRSLTEMFVKMEIVLPLFQTLQGALGGSGGALSFLGIGGGGSGPIPGSPAGPGVFAAANGGTFGPGWGVVGERGPELIKVHPGGVTVIPNHISKPYLPGFAAGGTLSASGGIGRFSGSATVPNVSVVVNNNADGAQATVKQKRSAGGGQEFEVLVDNVEQNLAGRMTQGDSVLNQSASGRYGLNRARGNARR